MKSRTPVSVASIKKERRGGRSWTAEFARAYGEGRFRDAAGIYDENARSEPVGTTILAARAHMHSAPSQALQLLLRLHVPPNQRHAQVETDLLLGEAYGRTGDFESADQRLEAAHQKAIRLGDSDLLSQVGYRFVRRFLLSNEPSKARKYLALTRAGLS